MAQAQDVAPVAFANPVASPVTIANNGDDDSTVALVGFGAVLAVGLISSVLLHWRGDACELDYTCSPENNPVCHGRGCDAHNRVDAGVESGSRQPHSGIDAMHKAKYGYGLCNKPQPRNVVGGGGGGSSML